VSRSGLLALETRPRTCSSGLISVPPFFYEAAVEINPVSSDLRVTHFFDRARESAPFTQQRAQTNLSNHQSRWNPADSVILLVALGVATLVRRRRV
jgi:hypothetical protein